jgi:hypothetical protein
MKYILTMIFFASIVGADDDIVDEIVPLIPVEETEYVTLRGDSLPAPDPAPVVVYPIEGFIRIEEDELP